jgi:IclR family transcriptional regulator, acetate operon repressor
MQNNLVDPPVRSVARAARCLLWIAERGGATATEAASEFNVPLPTMHHTLKSLVHEGLLERDHNRRYVVGHRVGILSDAFLRQHTVPDHLRHPLEWIAETTGETAYLAAWRASEIRILACVEGNQAVRVAGVHTGFYEHAHARATGKLLLAFAEESKRDHYLASHPLKRIAPKTVTRRSALLDQLEQVRELGYATDEDEFAPDVSCISCPVYDGDEVVCAVTVSAPTSRFLTSKSRLLEVLRHGAAMASLHDRVRVAREEALAKRV